MTGSPSYWQWKADWIKYNQIYSLFYFNNPILWILPLSDILKNDICWSFQGELNITIQWGFGSADFFQENTESL